MRTKRYLKIQDCFVFQCPQSWGHLKPTDKSGAKHFVECDCNVYIATDKAQLLKFGDEGKCAAYFAYENALLGMVNTYFEKD